MHRTRVTTFLLALLTLALAAAPALGAPTIAEYGAGTGATPGAVAAGTDGGVWFVDEAKPGAIGRIATSGSVARYTTGLTRDATFGALTAGPGGMWFTETSKNKIGRVSTSGTITEFAGSSHDKPVGITAGADGALWYTAQGKNGAIVRMTSAGKTTEFTAGLTTSSLPQDIVAGPDNALWFTEPASGRIGRITLQGTITEYPVALAGGTLSDIAAGPDGALWFTVKGTAPAIGRITTSGAMDTALITSGLPLNSAPQDITAGPDDALYFTDAGANAVGRLLPGTTTITMASAGLTAAASPDGLAAGADGAIWFAEHAAAGIARLTVAPTAATTTESDVTATTATLTASATANGQATTAHIDWDDDQDFGSFASSTPVAIGMGASPQTVTAHPTGLSANTSYYARVVAVNATGTATGPVRQFTTTAPGAPSATTLPATAVGASSATLNAAVNPENAPTIYHFEWGPTTAYGTSAPSVDGAVGSDATDHPVDATISGLRPNTTYHYRVVAAGSGTTNGADRMFRTAAVAPDAVTGDAAPTTADGAVAQGTVNPNNSATAYRFEWGTTTAFDTATPALDELVGDDDAPHAVSAALPAVEPNTTYHVRLVATSLAGTTYGADEPFTTDAVAPVIAGGTAADVTTTTATVTGTVDPRNSATRCWVEWGPTESYGARTAAVALEGPADLTAHPCSARLEALAPDAAYHARLVAENDGGVTRGPDVALRTAAAPAVPATTPAPPAAAPDASAPAPAFGRTVAVTAARGTVTFRTPDGKLHALTGSEAVPSGSTFDTTAGELRLTSAVDRAGHVQHARFRGARFRVTQPAAKGGMVVIETRERPAGCAAATPARTARVAAATKKRRKPRSLWGSDDHGRFTTQGRDATATVRGTEWITTETCAGTRVTVRQGAVSVYDKHTHRHRLVKAGGSYLARHR